MGERPHRSDNRFEHFEGPGSQHVDVPLSGKAFDELWMKRFSEWLDKRAKDGLNFRTSIWVKTLFLPSEQVTTEAGGPLFVEHAVDDPNRDYYLEGRVQGVAPMATYDGRYRQTPALYILDPAIIEAASWTLAARYDGQIAAVPFDQMPLLLRLMPHRG